ncbi:MAG TPA: hypothetical protein VFW46_20140 [Stellaceae bacterium]|nr:hypothetical protein [Stellaceae bacterium]
MIEAASRADEAVNIETGPDGKRRLRNSGPREQFTEVADAAIPKDPCLSGFHP